MKIKHNHTRNESIDDASVGVSVYHFRLNGNNFFAVGRFNDTRLLIIAHENQIYFVQYFS